MKYSFFDMWHDQQSKPEDLPKHYETSQDCRNPNHNKEEGWFKDEKDPYFNFTFSDEEESYDDFDFDKALQTAKLVINYNSNPAIDAVLSGVPIMTHESSRCWPVANKIGYTDNIKKPDRQQRANALLYQEWTEAELILDERFSRIRLKHSEFM